MMIVEVVIIIIIVLQILSSYIDNFVYDIIYIYVICMYVPYHTCISHIYRLSEPSLSLVF